MVNCKNCGAPLTLEDAYCPHCGTPNPEAQEHIRKLNKLDKDYRKTKEEVVNEVKKSKKGYNYLIVLVMLMLANLILIPFHSASYEIAEKIVASKMSKTDVETIMNDLVKNGDYIELSIFMDKFDFNYHDYYDYAQLSYLASEYSRMIGSISDYFYADELYSDPLVRACQYMQEFKSEYEYRLKRDTSPEMLKEMEKLNSEYENALKVFFKLNDDDVAEINDMSNSELVMRVMERMRSYEEN